MKKILVTLSTLVVLVICVTITCNFIETRTSLASEETTAETTEEVSTEETTTEAVCTWISEDGGKRYYIGSSYVRGLKTIDGKLYYFDKDGYMVTKTWIKQDGKTYYFGKTGAAKKGLCKISGNRYYFNESNAMVAKSWKTIDGKKYYFTKSGKAATGSKKIGKNYYYFNKNGVMQKNVWKYVKGYKYYYGKNGKRKNDVESIIGSQDSYYIVVNNGTNVVTVYAKDGDKGYTIPVKAFVCSVGGKTPTSGTYSTSAKYRWRELYGPCYGQWCTRITGHILFHSVPYYTQNANDLEVEEYNLLGTSASMGCVRLTAGDAKWIYDNCSLKTSVKFIQGTSKDDPLVAPETEELSSNHTWDPTDPNMAEKCEKNGCH